MEEAGVWRIKAEQCGKESDYSFLMAMLKYIRTRGFKDPEVFKVSLISFDNMASRETFNPTTSPLW